MNSIIERNITQLIERYPTLKSTSPSINEAFMMLERTVKNGGKIITCGNGGSFSDSIHIVGELIKGFTKKRPLDDKTKSELVKQFGDDGKFIGKTLQTGINSTTLGLQAAYSTAFINDVSAKLVFSQELMTIGNEQDTLICISTSGQSENVYYAAITGNYIGMNVILLTGEKEGKIREYSDCVISVPESDTYKIQELHLPVYHTICLALEETFFDE